MITPELISYVRQAIASGQTKEAISQVLVSQGWAATDIEQAFAGAYSASTSNTTAQQPIQNVTSTKKGVSVGKIIAWIFVLGFIGVVVLGGALAYFAYSKIRSIPSEICKDSKFSNNAECQQAVNGFWGYIMNSAKNSNSSSGQVKNSTVTDGSGKTSNAPDCANGFTEKGANGSDLGDITALVGINDPLICEYSRPADYSKINKILIDISGSKTGVKSSDAIKVIIEPNNNDKITIVDGKGISNTIESANSTSPLGGLTSLYLNVFRFQIPLMQMCIKSTDWNVNGRWFVCDKVTIMGMTVSDNKENSPVSNIMIDERSTSLGTAFFMETRRYENNVLTLNSIEVMKEGKLLKYNKTLTINN